MYSVITLGGDRYEIAAFDLPLIEAPPTSGVWITKYGREAPRRIYVGIFKNALRAEIWSADPPLQVLPVVEVPVIEEK